MVSTSSITKDLEKIQHFFKKYSIQLVSDKKGTYVIGDEYHKQLCQVTYLEERLSLKKKRRNIPRSYRRNGRFVKICKTSAKKQKMWNIFWRMISVPRLRSKSKKNCNEKYYSAFTSSRKAPVISWTKVVWEEISSATTANPRLCSQARVVSMEAFRDRRLVFHTAVWPC